MLLILCTQFTHKPAISMSFNPDLPVLLFQTQSKTREILTEAIYINYNLRPKYSLEICFNKLITYIRLPNWIKCDRKTVRETSENTLLHTNLGNRALSTRHLEQVLSNNMTNITEQN